MPATVRVGPRWTQSKPKKSAISAANSRMADIQQETFTDRPDDADAAEYQAVSAMAIVSLLVGLLSLLAFWHPVLWIMPVGGAAIGLLTIRQIEIGRAHV